MDVSLARGETWKKSCCGGKGGGGVVVVVGQFLFPSLKATLDINQTKLFEKKTQVESYLLLLRGFMATLVRIKKVYCVLFLTAAVRTTKARDMGKCVECHSSRLAVNTQRE